MNKQKFHSILFFLFIWICVAFPSGLWVLFAGPSKWLSVYARNTGMTLSNENFWGKLIILAYIILSLIIAAYLYRYLRRKKNKILSGGIIALLGILFLSSVYVFSLKPQWLISNSDVSETLVSGQTAEIKFILGPFPDEARMDSLRDHRFDGVISLLSELVIPAEPALLKKEMEYGEKIGLKVINIPMLPWISGNENSVERIKQLISEGKGLYYVHCYLGRDRVNVFKSLVEKYGTMIAAQKIGKIRKLEEIPQMERGKYYKLAEDIYFTPYPTDEEMFSYVLNGYFKTVVSTLDTTVAENAEWVGKEKNIMLEYNMKFIQLPLISGIDEEISGLTEMLKEQIKPILVHGFLTDDPISKKLIDSFHQ